MTQVVTEWLAVALYLAAAALLYTAMTKRFRGPGLGPIGSGDDGYSLPRSARYAALLLGGISLLAALLLTFSILG